MARPVILDCDTGTDDAVAIALAALHPDLDLLGVTTVWGNHELRHTTDNTLRVLDHLGFTDVPVHAGLAGPYAGRDPAVPGGRADLPPTLDLPEPTRPVASTDAVGWLVETLRAAAGPVALVATGPWSNVAAALVRDPRLLTHVDPLVLLGGAHRQAGVTPWAERNVWCDPGAAAAVLAAGVATTTVLVTMDATFGVPLDRADVASLGALGTPAGTLAARLLSDRIEWYSRDPELAAARCRAAARPARCRRAGRAGRGPHQARAGRGGDGTGGAAGADHLRPHPCGCGAPGGARRRLGGVPHPPDPRLLTQRGRVRPHVTERQQIPWDTDSESSSSRSGSS